MQLLHSHRTSLDILVTVLSPGSEFSVYPDNSDEIPEYSPIVTGA